MRILKKVCVIVGCFCVVIGAAGCASNDVVRKDEPIAGKEATAKAPATDAKAVQVIPKTEDVNKAAPAVTAPAVTATPEFQPAKTAATQAAFEKIYFNFDSSDLSQEARNTLTHSQEVLMNVQKDVKLRIEGNCDERGSAEYNLALGERTDQRHLVSCQRQGAPRAFETGLSGTEFALLGLDTLRQHAKLAFQRQPACRAEILFVGADFRCGLQHLGRAQIGRIVTALIFEP